MSSHRSLASTYRPRYGWVSRIRAWRSALCYGYRRSDNVRRLLAVHIVEDHATNDFDIGALIPVLSTNHEYRVLRTRDTDAGILAVTRTIAGPSAYLLTTIVKGFGTACCYPSTKDVARVRSYPQRPSTPGHTRHLHVLSARAISRIADAVAKNPKAFADFLNFIFQIVIALVDAIAWLTNVATYIETHFLPAIHDVANVFDEVRHNIAHTWDLIFENTVGTVIRLTRYRDAVHPMRQRGRGDIRRDAAIHYRPRLGPAYGSVTVGAVIRVWQKTDTPFANMRHDIAGIMDGMRHDIAHVWDMIYQDTTGA